MRRLKGEGFMKWNIKAIVAMVLTVALLCAGCAGSGNHASPKNISELPEYEKLSALIGCTLEEAIEKMGWQADEIVTEDDVYYKTPLTVDYAGVSFRVLLGINFSLQKISAISYLAEYENAAETAAKEILQVAKKLGGAIGQKTEGKNNAEHLVIFEMTEAKLQETLGEISKWQIRWNLNEAAETGQKDFINEIKEAKTWESYGEHRQPQYGLEMVITRVEDTVYLRLNLSIMPMLIE